MFNIELRIVSSLSCSSESVYNSSSLKFPCALHKRKILHPLLSSTTMLSMANNNSNNRNADKFITKRVLSAKEHRVKQLQNQLADAHFHLSVIHLFIFFDIKQTNKQRIADLICPTFLIHYRNYQMKIAFFALYKSVRILLFKGLL